MDDVRTDISTLFADNTVGDITPADLRSVMRDVLDSTSQDEANMRGGDIAQALTPTYLKIPALFDVAEGGDGVFLTQNLIDQSVQTASVAGFSYVLAVQVNCYGANNTPFSLAIFKDGVVFRETFFSTNGEQGAGARSLGVALQVYVNASTSDAVYDVRFAAPDTDTLTISSADILTAVLATNNP